MLKTHGKLLVATFAVAAALTSVSGGNAAAGEIPTPTVAEAIAALPASLTEEAFFAAVNGLNPLGFTVPGQGGTQAMIVSISISVPGSTPATPPADTSPQFSVDSFFDLNVDPGLAAPPGNTISDDLSRPPDDIASDLPPGSVPTFPAGRTPQDYTDDFIETEVEWNKLFSNNWLLSGNFSDVDLFFDINYQTPATEGPEAATGGGGTNESAGGVDFLDAVVGSASVIPSKYRRKLRDLTGQGDLYVTDSSGDRFALPSAVGEGLEHARLRNAQCSGAPADSVCDELLAARDSALALLQSCTTEGSPLCSSSPAPDDLSYDLGTYFVFIDDFGDFGDVVDVGEGFLLTVLPSVVAACIPESTTPGCDEFDDLKEDLELLDNACDGSSSNLCDPAGLDTPLATAVDTDWYSFTLDNNVLEEISALPAAPDCAGDDCGPNFDTAFMDFCDANATDPNCQAAGNVIEAARAVYSECITRFDTCEWINEPGTNLLEPGTYFLRVADVGRFSDFPEFDYVINIAPEAVSECIADPSADGCGAAAELGVAYQQYVVGCDQNPTDACSSTTLPAELGGIVLTVDPETRKLRPVPAAPSRVAARRTVVISPLADGHIEFRETGDSTGIFSVSETANYGFDVLSPAMLGSAFSALPPGSIIVDSDYRVRPVPGSDSAFLLRDDDGDVFLLDLGDRMAIDGSRSRHALTIDTSASDDTKVVLVGNGKRVALPVGDARIMNINTTPSAVASTPEEIAAAMDGTGADLVGVVTASGGSTGEVFFLNFVNFGKTAAVEGDVVLEALTDAEAVEVRALLARLGATNSTANGPGTAYCLEQEKTVPSSEQLFRFANGPKQRVFAFGGQLLSAGRAVAAAGGLHPDTADLKAYEDSIIQWSIWTVGRDFDKAGFEESFLDNTRKALEQAGQDWTGSIEDAVRGLVDNRWDDVQQVLDAAGRPTVNN